MNSAELIALAERVEQATGPDRHLNLAIANAIYGDEIAPVGTSQAYTGSLDAAMTLVPANSLWRAGVDIDGPYAVVLPPVGIGWLGSKECRSYSCTPALALCAAALRARAQAAQPSGGEE